MIRKHGATEKDIIKETEKIAPFVNTFIFQIILVLNTQNFQWEWEMFH